jgi:hypothetical protein
MGLQGGLGGLQETHSPLLVAPHVALFLHQFVPNFFINAVAYYCFNSFT